MGEGLGPYENPAEAFLSGSISACTENGFVTVSYTHLTLPTNREV